MRITDSEIVQHCSSLALKMFQKMLLCALYRAGHLSSEEETGITAELAPLLQRFGLREVQTKYYVTTYLSEKNEGRMYIEDVCYAMQTLKPFIQKWGYTGIDYEQICQVVREQMSRPDFYALWQLLTAWGIK